jgi:hypothetical protein
LINQIPYGDTSELYGTGELLFFVKQYKFIFGKVAFILLLIGGVIAGVETIKYFWKERKIKIDFILIEVLLFVYFAAHSYVWWSGTGASAGLVRVMAAIIPLAAISAVRSIDFLSKRNPLSKVYKTVFIILFSVYLISVPFITRQLPLKYGEREKTVASAIEWMKNSKYADVKVYFYEPLIYILLDRDPFDHSVIKELIDDRDYPEKATKVGELVFYDTHFGPNEGRLPLKNLMDNPYFKLLNYFEPLEPFKVLGGHNYALFIFERVNQHKGNNHQLLKKFKAGKTKSVLWKKLVIEPKKISSEEFTPVLEIKSSEIEGLNETQILSARMEYEFQESEEWMDIYLVISIEKNGETLIYKSESLSNNGTGKKEIVVANAVLSEKIEGDETIKIYIWSKTNQTGLIKSLDVYKVSKSY